jgi:hypothetical protein
MRAENRYTFSRPAPVSSEAGTGSHEECFKSKRFGFDSIGSGKALT